MRPILLDTCALIWLANKDGIARSALEAIDEADVTGTPVAVSPISAWEMVAASFLPSVALRDPGDRIIAATARHYRYRLMTRDRPLLAFGEEGHVETIAC